MSYREKRNLPPALSESGLRELILFAISKGYYRESFHSEAEHLERNISFDDVLYGLESVAWVFAEPPDFDERHKSWEYLIITTDIEGDYLTIKIAAFPDDKRFEVITRW